MVCILLPNKMSHTQPIEQQQLVIATIEKKILAYNYIEDTFRFVHA